MRIDDPRADVYGRRCPSLAASSVASRMTSVIPFPLSRVDRTRREPAAYVCETHAAYGPNSVLSLLCTSPTVTQRRVVARTCCSGAVGMAGARMAAAPCLAAIEQPPI